VFKHDYVTPRVHKCFESITGSRTPCDESVKCITASSVLLSKPLLGMNMILGKVLICQSKIYHFNHNNILKQYSKHVVFCLFVDNFLISLVLKQIFKILKITLFLLELIT